MYEFDPRWPDDPRDDDRDLRADALAEAGRALSRGNRGGVTHELAQVVRFVGVTEEPSEVKTRIAAVERSV
jgi:hypothetical protein